jgi:hypothetical protein
MEWKHQEAGPSVSTPLIRDKETMAHSSLRMKKQCAQKDGRH